MDQAYTYNDVLIIPRYSSIESRTEIDLSVDMGHIKLKLPVISANMKNITGSKMASCMALNGGLGILHRFCSIDENINMFEDAINRCNTHVGVSIGVKDEDKKRFTYLYESGARVFCIDVAHGHHILVERMCNWINDQLRNDREFITLIAGNIATEGGYQFLSMLGVDAVKVGIGPSRVCRTRFNTGVGIPQLYALEKISSRKNTLKGKLDNLPHIIADGGITCVGDISKALKYADTVMIGSLLAGCSETPGNVYRNDKGEFYKFYGGSASGENRGESRYVEGVVNAVKFQGEAKYILDEIAQGLQSAFSYVGASNLQEFKNRCEFIKQSIGSINESRIF